MIWLNLLHRMILFPLFLAELLHECLVIKGSPDFLDFALSNLKVIDAAWSLSSLLDDRDADSVSLKHHYMVRGEILPVLV
jgi:hypothetical protein